VELSTITNPTRNQLRVTRLHAEINSRASLHHDWDEDGGLKLSPARNHIRVRGWHKQVTFDISNCKANQLHHLKIKSRAPSLSLFFMRHAREDKERWFLLFCYGKTNFGDNYCTHKQATRRLKDRHLTHTSNIRKHTYFNYSEYNCINARLRRVSAQRLYFNHVTCHDYVTFGHNGSTSIMSSAMATSPPAAPALPRVRRASPRPRLSATPALSRLRRAPPRHYLLAALVLPQC
jgi:hypothetical protein